MAGKRTIVISGVSRGLGRALVEGFAREGHVVHGCARSEGAIRELARSLGTPSTFEALDVADEAAVAAWAGRVLAAETPDLVVSNAGIINESAPLWKVPGDEFSRVVDVNLKGTAHLIRHFLPSMLRRHAEDGRGGVIVNLSSGWGRSTSADVAPYCATKWAVEGLTRALAQELPEGLAAVPLNPGVIDTGMLRSCFADAAAHYPSPAAWARRAVPYILGLGAADNGEPRTVPGG